MTLQGRKVLHLRTVFSLNLIASAKILIISSASINQLHEIRKLLTLKRLQNYGNVIYHVNLNIRNRNAELTKPLIRLFRNSPRALLELLPVLSHFIKEKNEAKGSSFESKLFEAVRNLIKEKKGDTYELSNEHLCIECKNVMDGKKLLINPSHSIQLISGPYRTRK